MATFAVTLDNGSVITFEGNLTSLDPLGLPAGWTTDGSDPANVDMNGGSINGPVFAISEAGSSAFAAGSNVIEVNASDHLGFFGATPVAQPAAPTDAATIIAALQALGLVAT